MRTLVMPAVLAAVALGMIGLVAGDPRATRDLSVAASIDLAGLAVAIGVGVLTWRAGRRRAAWLLVPSVVLAVSGGLCGWIAGAEFTLAPDTAVHLATPGRAAFMLVMTAVGMALPAGGLALLVGRARSANA
jgi:hypothetical protein